MTPRIRSSNRLLCQVCATLSLYFVWALFPLLVFTFAFASATVTRVVDGDTIVSIGGRSGKVRLIGGEDAPTVWTISLTPFERVRLLEREAREKVAGLWGRE